MPKCEIFDRSDFGDFYTIKSLWGGGHFGVKIKVCFLIFRGSFVFGTDCDQDRIT